MSSTALRLENTRRALARRRREVEQSPVDTRYVVENEDYVAAAEGWANLKYLPRVQTIVYGQQEMALQHMHRTFAERIGMPLPTVR